MTMLSTESQRIWLPAPRLWITAWILSPLCSVGPEGDAELRQSLMRRLLAVVVSAVLSLLVAALAAVEHPDPLIFTWFVLEVLLTTVRLVIVFGLLRTAARGTGTETVAPVIVDLFVGLGTAWSASIGIGTMLCLRTGDPGLAIIAAMQAMGTIGAQGVRSPGTPRLNTLQMSLIMVPSMIGVMTTAIPLANWAALLIPPYLLGMISITRQLHEDYVRLIAARIENRQRALHCPLTGLPNRAFFHEALAARLDTADGRQRPVTVMYLDLDGFKRVNDERGHAAGDELLRNVAGRLRSWARSGTVVARLGGDEFAVILRPGDDAEADARAVIDALSRPYVVDADGEATVGVSIGFATAASAGDAAAVLMRADHALYAAKRAGKGTFRSYEAAGDPMADDGTLREIARRMRATGAPTAAAV